MKKLTGLFIGLLCLINNSYADLNEVVPGLIDDSVQNRTWMKDANLVRTACVAASGSEKALWDAFVLVQPTGGAHGIPNYTPSGRATTDICNADNGRLNWFEAELWIAILNSQNYLGGGWRQPITTQPDATCDSQDVVAGFPDQGYGYHCTGSEFPHLFNVAAPAGLGNPNQADDACFPNCFVNKGPFSNAQDHPYWSGTEYAPDTSVAWYFSAGFGDVSDDDKVTIYSYVWPVRSGPPQHISPQSVPTMSIWYLGILLGLIGLIGFRRGME